MYLNFQYPNDFLCFFSPQQFIQIVAPFFFNNNFIQSEITVGAYINTKIINWPIISNNIINLFYFPLKIQNENTQEIVALSHPESHHLPRIVLNQHWNHRHLFLFEPPRKFTFRIKISATDFGKGSLCELKKRKLLCLQSVLYQWEDYCGPVKQRCKRIRI